MKFWQLTVYLSFIFSFGLCAENDNSMELISVSQGLPNSHVNKIIKSKEGHLWLGTSNGLCYYDGYSFNVFQSVPFDTNTLADDNILDIVESDAQKIWLWTHYGIECLNQKSGRFDKISIVQGVDSLIGLVSRPSSSYAYCIYKQKVVGIDVENYEEKPVYETTNGQFLLTGKLIGNYLYLLASDKLIRINTRSFRLDEFDMPMTIEPNTNVNLLEWGYNHFIYSYKNFIFLYDLEKNHVKKIFSTSENILGVSNIVNSTFSVITLHNAFQLKLNKQNWNASSKELYREGKMHENISVFQDENQIVWLSTNEGVLKLNPHRTNIRHTKIPTRYLTPANLNSLVYESSKSGFIFKNNRGRFFYSNTVWGTVSQLPFEDKVTSFIDDGGNLWIGSNTGLKRFNKSKKVQYPVILFNNYEIYAIKEVDGFIWMSTSEGLFKGDGVKFDHICNLVFNDFVVYDDKVYFNSEQGFGELDIKTCAYHILLAESSKWGYIKVREVLQSFDGKIWLATNDGLYRFNPNSKKTLQEQFNIVYKGNVFSLIEAKKFPEVWFASDLGIGAINYRTGKIMHFANEDGIEQTSFRNKGVYFGINGELNFITNSQVISFSPEKIFRNRSIPQVEVSKVTIVEDDKETNHILLNSDTIILQPEARILKLSFSTFDFFAPRHTTFQYSFTASNKKAVWTSLQGNVLSLGGTSPGVYSLKVRAQNSHGVESKVQKMITVIVKSPLYRSNLAILFYGVMLVLIVVSLIHFRTRNLRRINKEYKEKERIAKKIEQQKEELTLKNKNITDSINYARRIQLAMMPSIKLFHAIFPDSFILHMPKDIVSGDFYWVNQVENKIFFSAVDCTGHGVPGAFMSIIGVELFRRITEIEKIYTPAEVLNSLSKNFERVFGDVDEMKLRDGMDLAFCSLNKEQTVLEYSGAFNPLYIVRDSSIIEIKGDRYSVGVYEDEVQSFKNHIIPLQDGDLIYIFTDGYVDQFGGPEGKKYKYRRFRHLLLALHQLPMSKQIDYLRKSIMEWKGNQEQVDDILVMGLRIHQEK